MKPSQVNLEARVGLFEIAILILTVIALGALVADTVLVLPQDISRIIQIFDTIVCVVFLTDFLVRFCRAEDKRAFMKWGWIDLLASIPNLDLLRWGRLARVLRILRLLRGIRSLQRVLSVILQNKAQSSAVSLGLAAFLLVAFSSVSILICDQRGDANIKTAEDAIWWSLTTVTTVGYGDKYPVTTEGRILGMVLMVGGIGMFGGLSGLVASFIVGGQDRKPPEMNEILQRLDRLEAMLMGLPPERPDAPPRDDGQG